MQRKKAKKSSASRSASTKTSTKSFSGFAMAAAASGQLDEFVAAKEALSASLLQVSGPAAFMAMSAATSPAPSDNLVGVGLGEKVVGGKHTGAMAVKLLVRVKYSEDQLSATDRLPETINGIPTDVEEVGTFRRFAAPAPGARTILASSRRRKNTVGRKSILQLMLADT